MVAGLTISATTSFSHDFWTNVIHNGVERKPGEEVMVARISAFVVGAVAITIAIGLGPTANVAFLVALAFAVAASANLPVIVLSIFWRRFNTTGAVAGLAVGLLASLGIILVSPSLMAIDPPTVTGTARHLIQAKAWFPLENPGILSIPLGFIGAILGTLLSHEPSSEHKFNELLVRSNTGLGSERAGAALSQLSPPARRMDERVLAAMAGRALVPFRSGTVMRFISAIRFQQYSMSAIIYSRPPRSNRLDMAEITYQTTGRKRRPPKLRSPFTGVREEYYYPPSKFVGQANLTDPDVIERFSEKNFPECFREYADLLSWDQYWHTTLDTSNPPFWKWFKVGGKINASYNCVDRHLAKYKNKAALIFVPEPESEAPVSVTYRELYVRVNEFAALLRDYCGLKSGDRVTIHMPMVPELPITMLACARLGVIHSVVFGGFSGEAAGCVRADSGSRMSDHDGRRLLSQWQDDRPQGQRLQRSR